MASFLPPNYRDNFRAMIEAGEAVVLAIKLRVRATGAVIDPAGRSFKQRIFEPGSAGTVVASAVGVIGVNGAAEPVIRFTLSGAVTAALLATGQEARDLKHTIVETTDPANEIDRVPPVPFLVRRSGAPRS